MYDSENEQRKEAKKEEKQRSNANIALHNFDYAFLAKPKSVYF